MKGKTLWHAKAKAAKVKRKAVKRRKVNGLKYTTKFVLSQDIIVKG